MVHDAFGTQLLINDHAVAYLTNIPGPALDSDDREYTSHQSPGRWREFRQGLKTAGEIEIQGYFDKDDTDGQITLFNMYNTGEQDEFKILFTNGVAWKFDAYVKGVQTPEINFDQDIPFTATLKVTGVPELLFGEELTEYTVTFTEGNEEENVTITVYNDPGRTDQEGSPKDTDASGVATKDLEPETYWYTAELSGYDDYNGSFQVTNADVGVSFEMVAED